MTMPETNPLSFLNLVGGRACLDFTNTVGSREAGARRDYLNSYADLAWWAEHAGLLAPGEGEALRERALSSAAEAEQVFTRAIDLREALYWIFSAVAAGRTADAADLEVLNRELSAAMSWARVAAAAGAYAWEWEAGGDLERVLWPLARSAAELLTAPELDRVGECPGEHCGWLYLDVSKNRSRRWCDMRDCGNRAKVRRHYQRARKGKVGEGS